MKQGVVFILFVPLILANVAGSQTSASVDRVLLQVSEPADNVSTTAGPVDAPGLAAPEPEAVRLANRIVQGNGALTLDPQVKTGGLWVSGDVDDALSRLRWIIGPEDKHLLRLEADKQVTLNTAELALAAKADEYSPDEARLQLATYITANEGLLLLLQITEGSHRYRLHIGRRAPTAAGEVAVKSSLNLDRNYDSRINPFRRNGIKLLNEQPPFGYDSMVGINPTTRWLNLPTKLLVPAGNITLHELAEAHAKVELGYDYLEQCSRPGAHNIAIEREEKLLSQRPLSKGVATRGMNRIFTADDGEPSLQPKGDRR